MAVGITGKYRLLKSIIEKIQRLMISPNLINSYILVTYLLFTF